MSAMETDFYEVLGVGRDADASTIKAKSQALTDVAMKMGQAIYQQEQAAAAEQPAEGVAAGSEGGNEEVVDAEFSEVDEDNKG